ncbi:MAG: MFS transporter [Anaerolineales bacterium]|nr:MFS transporter [Anaerolineales bacterium]
MLTRRHTTRALPPALVGSAFYWTFWSLVAFYAPFINVYFRELGLSGTQLGILATVFPLFALSAAPFLSSLADRRARRRRMLQLNLVGWAVVLLIYPRLGTFGAILMLAVFEAAVRSPAIPLTDSLISRMATRHRLNYGSLRLWGSLGFAAVATLSGRLWQTWGYRPMFWVAALAVLPALLLTNRLEEGAPVPPQDRRALGALLQDRGLLALIGGAFLVGIALYSTFVFGPVYLTELGGTQLHVGLLFGLSALAEVPVMQASDALVRRLRGGNALLLGYGAVAVGLLGHALAWSPASLIAASIVKGVGYGMFYVVTLRLIDERVPPDWTSTAQSLFQACLLGLAPLLTAGLSGAIYDRFGPAALYAGMTTTVLLAIGLLLVAGQRRWLDPATPVISA